MWRLESATDFDHALFSVMDMETLAAILAPNMKGEARDASQRLDCATQH